MYISLDNEKHVISGEALDGVLTELLVMGVQMYKEQTQSKQLAMKMFARKMLGEMETKAPAMRDVIRPKRGDDPVIHMAKVWAGILKQAAIESHATIQITTIEQGRASGITSIVFQPESTGESGRQLVDPGEKRIRKNHIRENASDTVEQVVS